jgi:hypothetical protein
MHTTDYDSTTHLNSHADTSVVGRNALVVLDYDRLVDVCGYDPKGPVTRSLRTVTAALLAYTHPQSGEVVILVVHQAVLIPSLHHNLLCPNQMRLNDVVVSEQPKFLTENPTDTTHAIVIPGKEEENLPPLTIPLDLQGLTSCFPMRKPSAEEYESCSRYDLTSEEPIFDPRDPTYASQEAACLITMDSSSQQGTIEAGRRRKGKRRLCGVVSSNATSKPSRGDADEDAQFYHLLMDTVCVSSLRTNPVGPGINASKLAKNWGIGLE